MRFARLVLRAYGRFTDEGLTFPPASEGDLQLVFGPNEAGKSTALSAVTDFLFGFEHRASYDFLHDKQALRVGASLETADGPLHAMRRRGQRQTLFAMDPVSLQEDTSSPLANDAVAALLAGLDRETYRMLFGLDLDRLTEGGRALVQGQGELGQSLFQAAAGLAALKRVGDELGAVADGLYTPTSRSRDLNKAIRDYAEQGREVKERSLRSGQWEAVEQQQRKTVESHERLLEERRRARDELGKLERIRRNLPELARRAGLRDALAPLLAAPRLAADAQQRRTAAEEQERNAGHAEQRAVAALQRLSEERASIVVDDALLAAAQAVERLYRQTDAQAQARDTLARNAGVLAAARMRLQALLDAIAPGTPMEAASQLLPAEELAASVHALLAEGAKLRVAHDNLRGQVLEKQAALDKARAELAVLPEPRCDEPSAAALEALSGLPQIEADLQRQCAEVEAERARLRHRAMELGRSDPSELARMPVPAGNEIDAFQDEFGKLEGRRAEVDAKLGAVRDRLRAYRQELVRLEADGDVVTPLQLKQQREHRDRLWKVVRRMFVEGDDKVRAAAATHGTDHAVPEAFERGMQEADRLADRLRSDTARITQHASCTAQIRDLDLEARALEEALVAIDAGRESLRERWMAMCAPLGVSAADVKSLGEWLHRRERVVEAFETLGRREAEVAAAKAGRDAQWGDLARVLHTCGLPEAAPGEGAALAMQRLRQHHQAVLAAKLAHDNAVARLGELRPELQRLNAQLEQAGEPLVRWDGHWTRALAALHLSTTTDEAAARARLAQLDRLRQAIDEVRAAERIETEQSRIVTAFERGVTELVAALERSPEGHAAEFWVRHLHEALNAARTSSERATRIDQDEQREQQERRRAAEDCDRARAVLAALARDASCDPQDLPEVQARAAERRSHEAELARIERMLEDSNGCAVARIEAEASAYDVDGIANALRALEERTRQLDEEEGAAREARAEALRAFKAIDGSAAAAVLQQEQAELGAQIQAYAQRWSRARMAAAVLQRVVQQYRERHQGPLLERASAIFAAITCGSFAGLTTDYVDDRQILLGDRSGGGRVSVEGMSKGTCDQLYLALRLATIEAHLASRGPIPVVVDDLLVQFDDERAVATLRQLRELSQRTQVLFFTHHEHLLELARTAGIVGAAAIHRLDRAAQAIDT